MSIVTGNRRKKKAGHGEGGTGMMLTSLMDIFIVLVLYLLVNQSDAIELAPPERVVLPDSAVDTLPRPSVQVSLSEREVLIMNKPIVAMGDVVNSTEPEIPAIRQEIERIKKEATGNKNMAGLDTELTILADRSVPFKVLKKVMTSASNAGYGKISFAVNQK